jgi:hypothetical protein
MYNSPCPSNKKFLQNADSLSALRTYLRLSILWFYYSCHYANTSLWNALKGMQTIIFRVTVCHVLY